MTTTALPLVALALSLPALAPQEKEIQVSGHAGWGGTAARGDWAPVLVDLDNRGDKDRDVLLALSWAFPGTNQPSANPGLGALYGKTGPVHHVPVTLAARSRKRVSVTLLCPDQERMSVWVYALPPQGGRALAGAELPTRSVESGHRFVAVVGADLPHGLPPAANAVAHVQPEALPEDWRGYAGLDALLWLDGRPAEIRSQAQADALRTWISSGGRLVVARAHETGIPGSALAELLPVVPKGVAQIDGLDLLRTSLPGRMTVLDSAVRSGRALAQKDRIPIVVDAPFDGGRVTFLAFDPAARPFSGWDGAGGFWDWLLGRPPAARPENIGEMRPPRILGAAALAQVAGRFPDVEPPAIGWLFVLIVAYLIVVGPLDYFVLRSFRRLELTWITFPAYVVGFTLFILVAGGAFMGRAAYQRELAVVDHHVASGFERRRALSAVLSPTDHVYSLREAEPLSSNFSTRSLFQDMSEKLSDTRLVHGKETRTEGWVLNRNFTGLALSDRCGRSPAPVTWTREGAQGISVRNASGTTFREARLVTAEGVFVLGDLPPGPSTFSAARRYDRPEAYAMAEGNAGMDSGDGRIAEAELNARTRSHLIRLSFGDVASENPTGFARTLPVRRFLESGGSVLVAWSESTTPQVSFDPFPSRQSGLQMNRFFLGAQP